MWVTQSVRRCHMHEDSYRISAHKELTLSLDGLKLRGNAEIEGRMQAELPER